MKKGFGIWTGILFAGSLVCSALIAFWTASHTGGHVEDWALTNMETGEIIPFTSETNSPGMPGKKGALYNIILANQDGKIIFMGEMNRERQYITGDLLSEDAYRAMALINQTDGRSYPLKNHLSAIVTNDYYISLTEQTAELFGQEKKRYRLSIFYCPVR